LNERHTASLCRVTRHGIVHFLVSVSLESVQFLTNFSVLSQVLPRGIGRLQFKRGGCDGDFRFPSVSDLRTCTAPHMTRLIPLLFFLSEGHAHRPRHPDCPPSPDGDSDSDAPLAEFPFRFLSFPSGLRLSLFWSLLTVDYALVTKRWRVC